MRIASALLLVAGYAVALPILFRFRAVFRERRIRWFVAFELAELALVVGFLLGGRPVPAAINAVAGVVLAGVWWETGRRVAAARPGPT